jgi:hypothetical protein
MKLVFNTSNVGRVPSPDQREKLCAGIASWRQLPGGQVLARLSEICCGRWGPPSNAGYGRHSWASSRDASMNRVTRDAGRVEPSGIWSMDCRNAAGAATSRTRRIAMAVALGALLWPAEHWAQPQVVFCGQAMWSAITTRS